MKKCVILSMDDPSDFEVYDHLLVKPLTDAGWHCDTLSWRDDSVDWDDYNLVMIRSPWDYQLDAEAFLEVLESIDKSTAHLENPLSIVHWNINKHYLRDLESQGVEIVPTLWKNDYARGELVSFFEQLNCQEIVIKPCVSAGAFDTFRIHQSQASQFENELVKKFSKRDYMVQPFVEAIVSEGEFSLFYFDDEFSHGILKTPKKNDFRVQEEYGGKLTKIEPQAALNIAAEKVLGAIDCSLLYARLDFVRTQSGFALMEAELIEPSLYFNLDPQAPVRFVKAVERRMKRLAI